MNPVLDAIVSAASRTLCGEGLGEPLPADPMPLVKEWYDQAKASGKYADFDAMTLCTVDDRGMPSARIVLCRRLWTDPPSIGFFTNRESRKGHELDLTKRAACVLHWPNEQRQVRIEGSVERLSDAESDEYFQQRAVISRLGAWASLQSRPLGARADLLRAVAEQAMRFGVDLLKPTGTHAIPRPPNWGGYRVYAESVELWMGGTGRLHDRAKWTRTSPIGQPAHWQATRLWP